MKKKSTRSSGANTVILKKSKEVLARKNPDGSVALLNLQQDSHFYAIDGIAAEFWLMIDGRKSIGEIQAALAKKHTPPEPQFSKDVSQLVKKLKTYKLLAE